MRNKRGFWVVVAAVSWLAASLGGAQPRGTIDACAFLRSKEVARILNVQIAGSKREDAGEVTPGDYVVPGTYSSTCLWTVLAQGPPPSDSSLSLNGASYVILNAMQWPKGSHAAGRFLQSFRDAAQSGAIDQPPVALDIAEGALWWGDGVAAFKGDRSFGVSVHLVAARDKERSMEETLARLIATRL